MDYNRMLKKISTEYEKILGENLVGIYVHGSIAFGCFNPNKSDIDFIVVVYKSLTTYEKESLIKILMDLESNAPTKGFEMSVVLSKYCKDFIYPTPYELHYSNDHLVSLKSNLMDYCSRMNGVDKDLAAHFTIIKKVGYAIVGKSVDEVFGKILDEYYFDSIKYDIENAKDDVISNSVYIILNLCRVLAYKEGGLILSKEKGGLWGVKNIPNKYGGVITGALESYRSDNEKDFEERLLLEFCDYMIDRIFS